MGKSRKWGRCILSFVLEAGMSSASIPVYVAPLDGGSGSGESNAKLPEIQTVTSIDFSTMENLDSLPEGWKISNGLGSSELVDEAEGKALKLTRSGDEGETSLVNNSLGIDESEYRYVTIDTRIKMGAEDYAKQFSIPYIQDKNGTTSYTLYTDGDWTQYKSHVNGKNVLEAGTLKKGEWQNVSMDIDMKTDTFRVSVDGEYLLAYAYPNASQEDIDAQVSALQAAIDSLEIADSVKPETPDEGEQGTGDSENPEEKPDSVIQQPENSSGNEDHDSTINTNKGNTPKTGDRTNVKVLADRKSVV